MRRSSPARPLALLLAVALVAVPASAESQSIGSRIKQNARAKVDARKKASEDSIVAAASKMVDSTAEKTGRGVDATVNKVGTVVDTAMNRTERGITSAATALTGGRDDRIAADLEAGRAIVRTLVWVEGTAELDPRSDATVGRIAKAIGATQSIYLLEAHVADGGDAAANQALSDARAAALKARLVAAGVPAGRLFAMAYGATRPPTDGGAAERIELAKMQ
jgi:outer membrane protein OmpA-like peptidoglycan-associated protein